MIGNPSKINVFWYKTLKNVTVLLDWMFRIKYGIAIAGFKLYRFTQ